jgi:hypothetical protein
MTAILSLNRGEAALMLGDLVVSGSPGQQPLPLPSRFAPEQEPIPQSFSDLAQKIVRVDEHCAIAWSGPVVYAKAVIKRVQESRGNGHLNLSIRDAIEDLGLFLHEQNRLSFIMYSMNTAPRQLKISAWNVATRTYPADGTKIYHAGSGGEHIMKYHRGYQLLSGPENVPEDARRSIIAQAACAFLGDITGGENHALGYGGGFEVMEADPKTMTIRKLPVASVIWSHDGESVALHGPIFLQSYDVDGALALDRLEVGGDCHRYLIDGLIRRPNLAALPPPNVAPYAYVHYLQDMTGRRSLSAVVASGDDPGQGFAIEHDFASGKIAYEFDPEFVRRVLMPAIQQDAA